MGSCEGIRRRRSSAAGPQQHRCVGTHVLHKSYQSIYRVFESFEDNAAQEKQPPLPTQQPNHAT